MYVRWKKRKMSERLNWGDIALTAALVECVRINGKPRQRNVAYLATIPVWAAGTKNRLGRPNGDTDIAGVGCAYMSRIMSFWRKVGKALDTLDGNIDRVRLEAQIAAKVPRPTAEDIAKDERSRAARKKGFAAIRAGRNPLAMRSDSNSRSGT